MSEKEQQPQKSSDLPFFARYLEGQYCEDLSEQEMEILGSQGQYITLAYPSDQEGKDITNAFQDFIAVTNKFPSDGDDQLPPDYRY